jgi:nicotinate-nucleotide adenylyltransferase
MISLAIAGKSGMRLVDLDSNPTYTIDTIRKAKAMRHGNEYVWVIGSGLVEEFPSWKDAGQIVKETKVVIVPEPGFERMKSGILNDGNSVVLWGAPRVDLDSTRIRDRLAGKKPVGSLVDAKVLAFIKKNKLYEKKQVK